MWIGTAALAVLVSVVFCLFLRTAALNVRARSDFQDLAQMVVRSTDGPAPSVFEPPGTQIAAEIPAARTPASTGSDAVDASAPGPAVTPVPGPGATPAAAPLADYEALYALNPNFFGRITVEGTKVDYPVMYSPDRPLQYLGHDFYGKFPYTGVPYLSPECDPEGSYFLVYGHHMKDGSMFAGLLAYEDPAFWAEHPTFLFDTRFEHRTYAVVAAFRARVLTKEQRGFRYYRYSALDDEDAFSEFMTHVRSLAAHDTGVETAFGDEILTLSTCAYHTEKGRFVVVAKRVE